MSETRAPNALRPTSDPKPVRPPAPAPGDCCGEGCAHCVLDMHDAAIERYEAELAAWLSRQGAA